jgi:hypothetical protein
MNKLFGVLALTLAFAVSAANAAENKATASPAACAAAKTAQEKHGLGCNLTKAEKAEIKKEKHS